MAITQGVIDELLKDYEKPEDLLGDGGLLRKLRKALIGASAGSGADAALGLREGRTRRAHGNANSCNGYSELETARSWCCDPSARQSSAHHLPHLEEMYVLAVGPDLINRVTDAVIEKSGSGRTAPLFVRCLGPTLL